MRDVKVFTAGTLSSLCFPFAPRDNMGTMQNDNEEEFSPLIEHLMPKASVEEKIEAQGNLNAFLEVMDRICTRLVEEGKTPFED